MTTVRFSDFRAQIAAKKAELGIEDAEERTEAARNKGQRRTPSKRELLRRIEERARAAGLEPINAHYEEP